MLIFARRPTTVLPTPLQHHYKMKNTSRIFVGCYILELGCLTNILQASTSCHSHIYFCSSLGDLASRTSLCPTQVAFHLPMLQPGEARKRKDLSLRSFLISFLKQNKTPKERERMQAGKKCPFATSKWWKYIEILGQKQLETAQHSFPKWQTWLCEICSKGLNSHFLRNITTLHHHIDGTGLQDHRFWESDSNWVTDSLIDKDESTFVLSSQVGSNRVPAATPSVLAPPSKAVSGVR